MPVPPKPPPRPGAAPPPKPEDALVRSRREKDELADECGKLEEELEELKVKYEMYFLGTERREPVQRREDLKKRVLRAKTAFTRNTGLRFRIQSLHARYISYERLWLRAAREREEGTYRRDLFKARLRGGARAATPAPPARAGDRKAPEQDDVDVSDLVPRAPAPVGSSLADVLAQTVPAVTPAPFPARPAATPVPAGPAPRPAARQPAASAPGGRLGDAQMRELFDAYVAAKKKCNEDVSKLSFDAVAKSVAKQVPEIMAKHKASSVDFRVVIKDGKAVLKAIPRS